MAFIQASFFSAVLAKQTALYAIVPEKGTGPFPVFYLLHGMSDDHTIWHRRTRIEWYVRDLPLIVVMPDGFRGCYTDWNEGPAYAKHMFEEVMGFVERTFPVARKRSARCIGGLSMGGYGSLRLAFERPELFASAHSHSGAMSLGRKKLGTASPWERLHAFGRNAQGSAHDLWAWVRKNKRAGKRLPKLRIDCGIADRLIEDNRAFHAFLEKENVAHEYAEFPGGHDWDYWDEHIQGALAFHARALGLQKRKRR